MDVVLGNHQPESGDIGIGSFRGDGGGNGRAGLNGDVPRSFAPFELKGRFEKREEEEE